MAEGIRGALDGGPNGAPWPRRQRSRLLNEPWRRSQSISIIEVGGVRPQRRRERSVRLEVHSRVQAAAASPHFVLPLRPQFFENVLYLGLCEVARHFGRRDKVQGLFDIATGELFARLAVVRIDISLLSDSPKIDRSRERHNAIAKWLHFTRGL